MNPTLRSLFRCAVPAAVLALASFTPMSAASAAGLVDFGQIPPPSSDGEMVEVQVPRHLVALAARIVGQEQPEIAKLLTSIESVRVRVVSLDEGNRTAVQERVSEIRADLKNSGWDQIVSARDGREDVAVFVRTGAEDVIEGVTITVLDADSEAVFVNVVGSVRPDQIAEIAKALHVPQLAAVGALVKH